MFENCPKLTDGQYYIYVLENSDGYIKIGITQNIQQRIKSLNGSNTGGSKLTRCVCTPPTYLYSLEKTMHTHFHYYRKNGEWFKGVTFEEVAGYLKQLIESPSFNRCNEIRKEFYLKHHQAPKLEE